jgi:adenylate cyclase
LLKKTTILHLFRHLANLTVMLIFLGYASQWLSFPFLQRLDNVVYDFRLRATAPNTMDPRIVIIDIDEKSLAQEGRWPWPRARFAQMVDTLFDRYGIDVLAFDIVFSEPDNSSGLSLLEQLSQGQLAQNPDFLKAFKTLQPKLVYDETFAASFENRPIVLGFYTSQRQEKINPDHALPPTLASAEQLAFAPLLPKAESYGANLRLFQQAAKSGGFFDNPMVDSDGVYRRIALLTQYGGNLYEALSLAIYRKALGSPPVQFVADDAYESQLSRLEGVHILDYVIPTDERGAILVPYRGKQKSFAYYSAGDVLNGAVEPAALEHKIAIVGATAAGLADIRSTPVQNVYPGVEIHANIVSGLLDRTIKSKPSYILGFEILELLLIGILSIALFARLPPLASVAAFICLLFAVGGGNVFLWDQLNIDSMPASPLLLLSLLFAVQIVFGYFQESRRKKYLSHVFGQYIPPELVEQMAHDSQDFNLAGESREMTVLFSDVRGFTGISEGLEPHELCELMNAILSPITEVIHRHHGTIDKYMGDAVMAFWGAPVNDAAHAHNAVTAALSILPALEDINWQFRARGWPKINIGIGLNTGKMNVGNMGSNFRMAYTVMGDAVNLGSRLEGLTKQYGVYIIVSETTREQTPEFIYRELDRVRVKGKKKPITIYQPLGKLQDVEAEWLPRLTILGRAMELYRISRWDEAYRLFQQLSEENPADLLYHIYLERIEYFKKNPPSSDWDGVFTHISK